MFLSLEINETKPNGWVIDIEETFELNNTSFVEDIIICWFADDK